MPTKFIQDVTLVTATFNRHDFTINMLQSLIRSANVAMNICILDNSTTNPFPGLSAPYINVVDNRNYKHTPDYNQASKNHSASLDWCFHNCIHTKYILLCDNDIIFKPSFIDLIPQYPNYDAIGEIGFDIIGPDRLFPYMCFIDREFMIKTGISYFDPERCMTPEGQMDTGCSFLNDLTDHNARILNIKFSDYIIHLKGGTLHNKPLNALTASSH